MKYLNLCALLLCGAFFSTQSKAQDNQCPDGGSFYDGYGCGVPAQLQEVCKLNTVTNWPAVHPFYVTTVILPLPVNQINETCPANTNVTEYANCANNVEYSYQLPELCSTNPFQVTMTRTVKQSQRYVPRPPEQPHPWTHQNDVYTNVKMAVASWIKTEDYSCPNDTYPLFIVPAEIEGSKLCFKPEQPPCDCSELAGEGYIVGSAFVAKKDVYSNANPPQCSTVTDPITGQQCNCQLIAQKWMQFGSGADVSWSPLPYEQGKPSGTYTGATCGEEDADTQPPEKEECFTLKTGQKWCFSNPAEKCTTVNGQQQCETGCGFINGDFVCYEDKDPIIPDRPDTPKKDIDDDITDPNKLMPDMTKGDLKDVQKGTEQRLDNIGISLDNNNNELKNLGDKIGQTNSKLDGIGQQLDGQGKTLKGIKDGLDDAFGDDGSPDGKCEGECTGSWYESVYPDGMVGIWQEHSAAMQQTPAFEFLNQFQLSPDGAQPDFNFCFNLGAAGDFGCHSLELPAILWPFIRICILISAAFLCRALIFGG